MLAMSFLTANFKWILLAVVLFAMLIVGYVADKTDFGHKKTSKKEIENPNKVEELDLDNLKGKTLSDMVGGSNETEAKDINEDLNAPFGDTVNTNEDINNMDALYAPIGEDLNAPLSDTTNTETPIVGEDLTAPIETTEEPKNEDIFTPISEETVEVQDAAQPETNTDIFAPIGEEQVETPVENVETASTDFDFEPIKEENEALDEVMPEVKIENMPETDDILAPVEPTNDILDNPIQESESINLETPTDDVIMDNPVQEETTETPVETIDIPDESDEVIIPASEEIPVVETPVETIDIPMETPIVEETLPEVTEEEKPKKKKKSKKAKEEAEKYDMDYEQEIVPEVITEKFNDGNNEEIASDDDIWKF